MFQVMHDDTFIISSSTALGMAEYLLTLLNTVTQNLPEPELHKMRDAMDHSVALVDERLHSMAVSSAFDALTVDDGTCVFPSALVFPCPLI